MTPTQGTADVNLDDIYLDPRFWGPSAEAVETVRTWLRDE